MRPFVARFTFLCLMALAVCLPISGAWAQDSHINSDLSNSNVQVQSPKIAPHVTGTGANETSSASSRIDSIPSFHGSFTVEGADPTGTPRKTWNYTMAGAAPQQGGTTLIDTSVIPVSLDLLDSDGSVRYHYDVTDYIGSVLMSPVFQNAEYASSTTPTQFVDAVQRAEFFDVAKPDWHTLLRATLKRGRTLRIPRGFYTAALFDDDICCRYVLVEINEFEDLMFPGKPHDTASIIGAAEADGDMSPHGITSFLLPNTFLYMNGNLQNCCVLGYHSYDDEASENNAPTQRYVLNISSWISPGPFQQFEDVTAFSHEMSETVNDPFQDNVTPWWKSPNGRCQNNLEVGDVIEGMTLATYPMTMNGMTYHPQNEAMLSWFESQTPSTALGGAYSYPNQNTLTQASTPQNKNCK